MKFIHTADIHLDSPLRGLSSYQNAPVETLRTATRDAFSKLIDVAVEEQVDFVVIAGDLYDGSWKDYNTGHFFIREMARLKEAAIPVYLLFGNHDADSEMTKKLPFPLNVHVFDSRKPTTYRLDALRVALHGRSFREAATLENLAVGYPDRVEGWLNIGVLHTALEGNALHAKYAPCSLAELTAKGYDYWALGHVHEYGVLRQDPWVVFPGNLQGRHIRETGPRGAVLVTADETGIVEVERLIVDVLRWARVEVDVTSAHELTDVIALASRALNELVAEAQGDKLTAVRMTLTGASAAHGALFGQEAELREQVVALAASVGGERLWIEKVRIETTLAIDPVGFVGRSDALAELYALLEQAPTDEGFVRDLAKDLQLLAGKAPSELNEAVAELKDIRAGEVAAVIRSVIPGLIAELARST